MMKAESNEPSFPRWMSITLALAAIYNLLWGAWVVLRPNDLFVLTDIELPNYPGIWQCVGMIVGVYGIGYAIAAADPMRHWPITFVGFLGKVFGPIGFLYTILVLGPGDSGYLPPSWGMTIITNDLIWWVPFAAILYQTFKHHNAPEYNAGEYQNVKLSSARLGENSSGSIGWLSVGQANEVFCNQNEISLAQLSRQSPLMILFLRHRGCTFCREALSDLSIKKDSLIAAGVLPVLVHQGDPAKARSDFSSYGLGEIDHVSDPGCQLYRAYDLRRGRFLQLFGPSVWWAGFKAGVISGHGVGKLDGDGFQMPGAFLVKDNQIIEAYRHQTAADLPDLCELALRKSG